jgi:hypothetical protein
MHHQFQVFKEKGMNCENFRFLDNFAWIFLKFLDIVEKVSEILDSKFFLII